MNDEIRKIPLAKPSISNEEIEAIKRVSESGCLAGNCEEVHLFEKEFASFVGSKYAVATSSCTTALHLACVALGVNKKSKVIVPAYTHPATALAPMYCGAEPEIVDVYMDTWNIDLAKIHSRKPDVIIPVHTFGNPSGISKVSDWAVKHDVSIIEDAACAIPALSDSRYAGTIGDIGCYSFYPTKNLCTGEGGMLVTNDQEIADTVKCLVDFGKTGTLLKSRFIRPGYNYRLSAIQAAMGRVQLHKLPVMHENRKKIAKLYDSFVYSELIGKAKHQKVDTDSVSAYQRYSLILDLKYDRDQVLKDLTSLGIGCTIGTFDLSLQPYYYKYCNGVSISKDLYYQSISFPMYPDLTADDVSYVCSSLASVLEE